jgi:hypothetical protein
MSWINSVCGHLSRVWRSRWLRYFDVQLLLSVACDSQLLYSSRPFARDIAQNRLLVIYHLLIPRNASPASEVCYKPSIQDALPVRQRIQRKKRVIR